LVDGVRARNGTIAGFMRCVFTEGGTNTSRFADLMVRDCFHGIFLSADASIERVEVNRTSGACIGAISFSSRIVITGTQVRNCGTGGISANGEARVEASVIDWTGVRGVLAGDSSVLIGITVRRAGSSFANEPGILCGRACSVSDSTVRDGGGPGITAGELSSISGNRVDLNIGNAIQAGDASTVRANTIGAAVFAGGGPFEGVRCGFGCNVFDNVVRNSSTPVSLSTDSRYGRNVFSLYANPPTGGVSAGDNLCNGVSC
jgi:hypothetical protein